jgi:hypothetical protein
MLRQRLPSDGDATVLGEAALANAMRAAARLSKLAYSSYNLAYSAGDGRVREIRF